MKYLSMDTRQAAIMAALRNETELSEILAEGIVTPVHRHRAEKYVDKHMSKGRYIVDDRGSVKRVEAI